MIEVLVEASNGIIGQRLESNPSFTVTNARATLKFLAAALQCKVVLAVLEKGSIREFTYLGCGIGEQDPLEAAVLLIAESGRLCVMLDDRYNEALSPTSSCKGSVKSFGSLPLSSSQGCSVDSKSRSEPDEATLNASLKNEMLCIASIYTHLRSNDPGVSRYA